MEDKKNSKKNDEKKEVCEIFNIKKEGKEEVKKICGIQEVKHATNAQIKEQNKILRNFLIGVGILVILFVAGWAFINSVRHFEYEGVKFDVVQEGKLILYRTSLPVIYNGARVPYNFYLRNDPRKLKKVELEGEIVLLENMVVNMTQDFNCEGDGIIAIPNVLNLYRLIGVKIIQDKNASCDFQEQYTHGRYMYLNIQPGEETKIEQVGPACYNMEIKECEILEGTEKFMVETFVKINEELNK